MNLLDYLDNHIQEILNRPAMYCHNTEAVFDVFIELMLIRNMCLVQFTLADKINFDKLVNFLQEETYKYFNMTEVCQLSPPTIFKNNNKLDELPEFLLMCYKKIKSNKI